MASYQVEYFELTSGEQPAEVYEDATNSKLRGKLFRYTVAVAESRMTIGGGIVKKCDDHPGIFEIRVRHHKDLARTFCIVDGDRLVLLDGVVKREGEATPKESFLKAAEHKKEYEKTRRVSPESGDGRK